MRGGRLREALLLLVGFAALLLWFTPLPPLHAPRQPHDAPRRRFEDEEEDFAGEEDGEELPRGGRAVYVYATFTDGEVLGEGMHVLISTDARSWAPLVAGDPVLLRSAGTVFRDPSIVYSDGWFHVVYTTELCAGVRQLSFACDWTARETDVPPRFGYARSRDMVVWEDHRTVPVELPNACNVWAPEWVTVTRADARAFLLRGPTNRLARRAVVFSATVADPCPADFGPSARGAWSKLYITSATLPHWDSPKKAAAKAAKAKAAGKPPPAKPRAFFGASARLLWEPDEPVIDATFFREPDAQAPYGSWVYAVYKSEQNSCTQWKWRAGAHLGADTGCTLALRIARAPTLRGPWGRAPLGDTPAFTNAISNPCAEGPTVVRAGGEWLVYYDTYRTDCPLLAPRVGGGCAPRAGLELVGERRGACEYRGRGGISALASDNLRDWAEAGGLERPPPREHKHGTIVGFADGHSRAPARVIKSWGALEEAPKSSHERRRRRRGRVARNVALSDEARRLLSPFVVSYERVWLMRVN